MSGKNQEALQDGWRNEDWKPQVSHGKMDEHHRTLMSADPRGWYVCRTQSQIYNQGGMWRELICIQKAHRRGR